MRETDLIISPIVIRTKQGIYGEDYGYTKISGSISDLIHYGKPALIPAAYPLQPALAPLVQTYLDRADFSQKLQQLISGDLLEAMRRQIVQVLAPFETPAVRTQLIDCLGKLARTS
jgi:hypothetical protein